MTLVPSCKVNVSVEDGIEIRTDRAIPAVLLVNELITNAAKYAYPAGNCKVWVTLSRQPNDNIAISVRDEGIGLPPTFDIKSGRRLGMRLVDSSPSSFKAIWTFSEKSLVLSSF